MPSIQSEPSQASSVVAANDSMTAASAISEGMNQ